VARTPAVRGKATPVPRTPRVAHGAPYHILADCPRGSSPKAAHRGVSAHRIDVRIAPVPAKDGKRRRSHHVGRTAGAVAMVAQGATFQEPLTASAHVQKLREVDQLPLPCHGRIHIELGVIPSSGGIRRPGSERLFEQKIRLTLRGDSRSDRNAHACPTKLAIYPRTRHFHSRF